MISNLIEFFEVLTWPALKEDYFWKGDCFTVSRWTVIYMLNTQKGDFNWRSYFNIHTKKRWIFHCCPRWTVIYMLNAQKNGPGSRQDKSSSNPSQKREIRRTVLVKEKRTKLNILLLSTRSQNQEHSKESNWLKFSTIWFTILNLYLGFSDSQGLNNL